MKASKKKKSTKLHIKWFIALGIVATFGVFALYLNTANNHFYHRLHTAHLVWPQNNETYMVGTAEGATIKYVALGDSLTTGVGADNFTQTYSYLVAQKIIKPNQGIILSPLATPGFKSTDILSQNVDKAIKIQPDIVTLLIGVNDVHGMQPSTKQFAANYNDIVSKLRASTKAKIYVVAIPSIGSNNVIWEPYRTYYSSRTRQFNEIIKDTAQKNGATYIDLYTATLPYAAKNSSYYSRDEFHPSAAGYAVWSEVIASDINN